MYKKKQKQPILYCSLPQHFKQEIQKVCLNEFCNKSKLICHKCLQSDLHIAHYKDVIELTELPEYVKLKSNDCEELITKIQQQMDKVQLLFKKLTRGLKYKYQLNEGKLEYLNVAQITQALEEYLKLNGLKDEISQSIAQSVENFCSVVDDIYSSLCLDHISYQECDLEYAKTDVVNFDDEKQQELLVQQQDQNFENLWGKGDTLKMQGLYDEALEQINKALEINPDHVNSLQTKGECLRLLKKFSEALPWLDKALNIDPHHVNSLWNKGECLRMLKQRDDAKVWFDKALEINPMHAQSLFSKGENLRILNKYEEAITWLDQVLQIDPNHVNSLYNKGECLRMLDQYDEALICLDKALSINSKHINTLFNKAACLRHLKRYQEALDIIQLALQIDPNHELSVYTKASCLKKLHNYKEAIIWFENALVLNPLQNIYKNEKEFCLQKLVQKE